MKMIKQLAFVLLGIWLIYTGLTAFISINLPSYIPGAVAILAGIGIIVKN